MLLMNEINGGAQKFTRGTNLFNSVTHKVVITKLVQCRIKNYRLKMACVCQNSSSVLYC